MKEAFIFTVLALVVISSTTQAAPPSLGLFKEDCPDTQVWDSCGTACPNICGEPKAFMCTMQCVIGCQCPTDWWRYGDTCVEKETDCPPEISPPIIEEYIEPWNPPMLGGWSDWDEAHEEVQEVADAMRDEIEARMGVDSFETFTAESYKSQVVNGWNYRIKIDVGRPHLLEVFVYKHFSGRMELHESEFDMPKCPFNQEWNDCGTACPKTCGEEEPMFCTYNCVAECQCPDGWWMQSNGICVEEASQCSFPEPDACASEPCQNGGTCELPMDDPEPGDFYCWCPEGFTGTLCDFEIPECPHNQEFNECGTDCPNICGEPEQHICNFKCNIGCQCPWGWWQMEDGSCVESEEECRIPEPECPHNQEFNECGTACPKICGEPEPLFCTMQCEIGCQCPWGWWQKEDGSCVETEEECGIVVEECPNNQEFTNCGTACPRVCGQEDPLFCTMQCVIGCQCPSGWWLDGDTCVEQESECS